jgi:monothiol glutaredoxin
MRPVLSEQKIHPEAQKTIQTFHSEVVEECRLAIESNEWVIIGMGQNPYVKKSRNLLASKGIAFKYLEYGNYFSQWKLRLAIKLWSGWPTFPQVFHKGVLVGGFSDLRKYLNH